MRVIQAKKLDLEWDGMSEIKDKKGKGKSMAITAFFCNRRKIFHGGVRGLVRPRPFPIGPAGGFGRDSPAENVRHSQDRDDVNGIFSKRCSASLANMA